jgi:hypothetical protein
MDEEGKEPPLPYGAFEPVPKRMPPPGIDQYVKERLWPARLIAIRDWVLPPLTIGLVLIVGYLRFSSSLNIFSAAVSGYWLGLLSGSGGTVALLLIERFVLKVPISRAWYAVTLMGFMFFGCFQAWEKEYLSRVQREKDLIVANMDRDKWKAIATEDRQAATKSVSTAPIQLATSPNIELKKRLLKLINELRTMIAEGAAKSPKSGFDIQKIDIDRAKEKDRWEREYNRLVAIDKERFDAYYLYCAKTLRDGN